MPVDIIRTLGKKVYKNRTIKISKIIYLFIERYINNKIKQCLCVCLYKQYLVTINTKWSCRVIVIELRQIVDSISRIIMAENRINVVWLLIDYPTT